MIESPSPPTALRFGPLPWVAGLAWLAYGIAWGLPAAGDSFTGTGTSLPGWEAFRMALAPVWPYHGLAASSVLASGFSVASGLTNLLMIASPAILFCGVTPLRAACGWALVLAGLLNAGWMWPVGGVSDLAIGYHVWWISFLALGIGTLARSRADLEPAPG